MGMLKGNANALNFDQLMAKATQVALQQDASLMERARQKRKEAEEKRRQEEKLERERQLAEQKRESAILEQKKKQLESAKKKPSVKKQQHQQQQQKSLSKTSINSKKSISYPFIPEKKKPVHMSFEDLMKKAKEQSTVKKEPTTKESNPKESISKPSTSKESFKKTTHTPSLYLQSKRPEVSKSSTIREKPRQSIAEPLKKSIQPLKKDRPSVQRSSKYPEEEKRKRPLSPPRQRPVERRPELKRMPFTGRSLDPRRSVDRRRYREEEEEDDDLDSFIDDDEEDEYERKRFRKNSYSDEISKIFKYDRTKYVNDPVFSDDDMEADASAVLREEKRSERIARREDYLEEQKELERLERLKKRKKSGH